MVRAFEGPTGAVTWAVTAADDSGCRYRVEAWGEDAAWAVEQSPLWLGINDRPETFQPDHPKLKRLQRDMRGLRIGQNPSIFDILVRLVFQQRVAWRDAASSYRRLTLAYGQTAPGPHDLTSALSPAAWRRIPMAEFVARGVEAKRARTIRQAAVSARRIEELREMDRVSANRRLRALPGVGVWTAMGVLGFGLGDPDAVQEQDYDLPRLVSFGLAGEPRGDDKRMLELLAPFAGHRFRVCLMLDASNIRAPRFGPRRARPQWERYRPSG